MTTDPSSPALSPLPANRSFGRRRGRPLKGSRQDALATLPEYEIPLSLSAGAGEIDPRALFTAPVQKIWFEIGFGSGEHLRARLLANPEDGFIGAEPYVNGMSAMLSGLRGMPGSYTPRLRLHMDDALQILQKLKPHGLDGIYLLNPDPWPKKRHHKRRIVNPENLELFARVLKPGGEFIFSTDVEELAEWTRDHFKECPYFDILEESAKNPHTPPPGWPLTTRYMAWGMSEGRKPYFFVYKRTAQDITLDT